MNVFLGLAFSRLHAFNRWKEGGTFFVVLYFYEDEYDGYEHRGLRIEGCGARKGCTEERERWYI